MKLVLAMLLASGCMKQSEKYCAMHPEDTEHCSGDTDGGSGCLGNDECIAIDPTKPVCTDTMMCVECTVEDAAACTGGSVCRGTTCGGCEAHSECQSDVCQDNGRCADAAMVAYVDASGSGTACTQASPCADLIAAEATDRPVIKVSGTISESSAAQFTARSTAIYAAPNAAVTRTTAGNVIEVSTNGTELAIYDLRIFGATGSGTGNGVSIPNQSNPKLTLVRVIIEGNDGSGVRALDGGDVTITRSVIANNTGNQGVYLVNGTFSITNTVIAQNGKTTIITGGALLQPAGAHTFEFNTVADNVSMGGAGNYRGISCSPGLELANNIITGNDTSMCAVTYSLFTPGDQPTGQGNQSGDPMFKATSGANSPQFYRITMQSAAKDKADAAATLNMDIDGNMRPVDGRSDMGADEVTP